MVSRLVWKFLVWKLSKHHPNQPHRPKQPSQPRVAWRLLVRRRLLLSCRRSRRPHAGLQRLHPWLPPGKDPGLIFKSRFCLLSFLPISGFGKTKTLKFFSKTSPFSRSFAKQMTNKKKKDAVSHASATQRKERVDVSQS